MWYPLAVICILIQDSPILTDAIDNSGLATITYPDTSNPPRQKVGTVRPGFRLVSDINLKGTIFYIGQTVNGSGVLREKRKIFSSDDPWKDGSLSLENYILLPDNMNWDGFRMAAVYHGTMAGCRLFYHAGNAAGNATENWIQELIWYQNEDTWQPGFRIDGALPNSHLSATIDDSSRILRLFYLNEDKKLQYSYTNITEGQAYQKGFPPGNPPHLFRELNIFWIR